MRLGLPVVGTRTSSRVLESQVLHRTDGNDFPLPQESRLLLLLAFSG